MKRKTRILVTAAALVIVAAAVGRAAGANVYRVELNGNAAMFAKTPPVPQGNRLVFSRYPDGAVVSLKRADVRRVVVTTAVAPAYVAKTVKPGTLVVLGPTGGGAASAPGGAEGAAAGNRPGEGPGGTAMMNPSRTYRPDWDARQVPGQTLGYPASPGDYREGATFAYPPGNAAQSSPGQPPTGVPSGEPPKPPN